MMAALITIGWVLLVICVVALVSMAGGRDRDE